jgi:hypothetical protein
MTLGRGTVWRWEWNCPGAWASAEANPFNTSTSARRAAQMLIGS